MLDKSSNKKWTVWNGIKQEVHCSNEKGLRLCSHKIEGATCPFVKRIICDGIGNTLMCENKVGCIFKE